MAQDATDAVGDMIVGMAVKPIPERKQLLAEYKLATQRYTWAVGALHRQAINVAQEDYAKLWKVVREARVEAAKALRALNRFNA